MSSQYLSCYRSGPPHFIALRSNSVCAWSDIRPWKHCAWLEPELKIGHVFHGWLGIITDEFADLNLEVHFQYHLQMTSRPTFVVSVPSAPKAEDLCAFEKGKKKSSWMTISPVKIFRCKFGSQK